MQDLERLRYECLTREHLILRTKAVGIRVGALAFALFATWHLGWTASAVGGAGVITSFVFQGLATLILFALHWGRFYDVLAARTESRINLLLAFVVCEEQSLGERWLRTGGFPRTAEFDSKRGAWLAWWTVGTIAAIWIVCVFVGCIDALRVLKDNGGKLIVWLFAFTVWTTFNLGFFWLHMTRPASMPSVNPDSPAA